MFNRHFGELRLLDYSGATALCVLLYLAWLSKTEIRNLYLSPICHPLGVQKMEDESDECIFEYKSEPNLALNFHPLPEN